MKLGSRVECSARGCVLGGHHGRRGSLLERQAHPFSRGGCGEECPLVGREASLCWPGPGIDPTPHWGSEGSGWRGGAPWSLLLLPGWRCLVVSRVPPWLALVLRNWELQEELAAGPCWRGSPRWRSAAPAQGRATSQEGSLGGWQVVFRHESQAEAQGPCRLCRDVGGWGEDSASRTPLTASPRPA